MATALKKLTLWTEAFKDKTKIMPTILANLGKNYADIIHQLDVFNQFFAAQRFGYAGRNISNILADVIGPLPKELPTPENNLPVKVTNLELAQVLNGLVNRAAHEDHHVEIFACFHDVTNGATDLETLITDIKAYKETKDVMKILDGIVHIGNILVNLPADMKDCSATGKVVKRLSQWSINFADKAKILPMIFGNFTKNFVPLVAELDLLNQRAAVNHWGNVGRSLGTVLDLTIGPLPAPTTTEPINESIELIGEPIDLTEEPKDIDEISMT
jgi:hypothetical protein